MNKWAIAFRPLRALTPPGIYPAGDWYVLQHTSDGTIEHAPSHKSLEDAIKTIAQKTCAEVLIGIITTEDSP